MHQPSVGESETTERGYAKPMASRLAKQDICEHGGNCQQEFRKALPEHPDPDSNCCDDGYRSVSGCDEWCWRTGVGGVIREDVSDSLCSRWTPSVPRVSEGSEPLVFGSLAARGAGSSASRTGASGVNPQSANTRATNCGAYCGQSGSNSTARRFSCSSTAGVTLPTTLTRARAIAVNSDTAVGGHSWNSMFTLALPSDHPVSATW